MVKNYGVEQRLVMCGINLPSGLGPSIVDGGALEGIQPVKALDRTPISNAWGKARKVVGPSVNVR